VFEDHTLSAFTSEPSEKLITATATGWWQSKASFLAGEQHLWLRFMIMMICVSSVEFDGLIVCAAGLGEALYRRVWAVVKRERKSGGSGKKTLLFVGHSFINSSDINEIDRTISKALLCNRHQTINNTLFTYCIIVLLLLSHSDESQVGPYLSPLSRGRRNCSSSPQKM